MYLPLLVGIYFLFVTSLLLFTSTHSRCISDYPYRSIYWSAESEICCCCLSLVCCSPKPYIQFIMSVFMENLEIDPYVNVNFISNVCNSRITVVGTKILWIFRVNSSIKVVEHEEALRTSNALEILSKYFSIIRLTFFSYWSLPFFYA